MTGSQGSPHDMSPDTNAALLFGNGDRQLSACVGEELRAISRHLVSEIRGATVILGGSFSVGEGKCFLQDGRKVIDSDYDLIVITPSFLHSRPHLVRKRLDPLMKTTRLSTHLEINLMWKPFLKLHLTTAFGRIIGGRKDIDDLLGSMPPPSPFKAVITAYRFLAEAPLERRKYSRLLSKALVRAAHAAMIHRYREMPREDWGRLESMRYVHQIIEECADIFDEKAMVAVRKAGDHLLDGCDAAWTAEDYGLARDILRSVRNVVFQDARRPQDFVRHSFWLINNRLRGLPSPRADFYAIEALQALVAAWGDGCVLRKDKVAEASRRTYRLCAHPYGTKVDDPSTAYTQIYRLLASFIAYYPHKIRYAPRDRHRSCG